MKKSQQITVRVKGNGDSKQRAFAAALAQVQREVLKNTSNIILRIEPLDVQVICATEELSTEKFLFFFLARKKTFYELTLDVAIELSFVDMSEITFSTK